MPDTLPRITPEEMKSLLMKRHAVFIGDDDPILLSVTLHNAFLDQYDAMLERHEEAVTSFLRQTSSRLIEEITAHKNAVLGKAVRASIENTLAEISQHQKSMTHAHVAMENLAHRLTWLTVLSGIFALIALIAAIRSWA